MATREQEIARITAKIRYLMQPYDGPNKPLPLHVWDAVQGYRAQIRALM